MAAREELGVKPRSSVMRFYTTSTLVSAALPKAPIVAAHRHVAGGNLPAVNAVLTQFATNEVKHQLYQAAIGSVHTEATATTARLVGDMVIRGPKGEEGGDKKSGGAGSSAATSCAPSKPPTSTSVASGKQRVAAPSESPTWR